MVLAFPHINIWLVLGLVGQLMFSGRFIIQWLASEKARKSVLPHLFWYFSLAGGGALFIYALHQQDPVFIMGQGMGLFIYARNLMLNRTPKKHSSKAVTA